MIDVDMTIDWRTLERALNTLPNAMAKAQLRGAMKKALVPVKADAERLAPVLTGRLKKSIVIGPTLSKWQRAGKLGGGAVQMFVGSTAHYGAFVEFGTSKMSPKPFVRPAWDMNKKEVLNIFAREVWKNLERTAKRLAKQAAAGKLTKAGAKALRV